MVSKRRPSRAERKYYPPKRLLARQRLVAPKDSCIDGISNLFGKVSIASPPSIKGCRKSNSTKENCTTLVKRSNNGLRSGRINWVSLINLWSYLENHPEYKRAICKLAESARFTLYD
jgi:hypothetical protein